MDKLPPIPTPAGQRWRAFRIHGLPMITFACVALSVAFLWKSLEAPSGRVGGAVKADAIGLQRPTVAHSNGIAGAPILVSMELVPGESVDVSTKRAKP